MLDNISIQFVTDQAGNKQAVLISINEWEELQKEMKALQEYRSLKESLTTAFQEVQQMKKGQLPKKSLSSFLKAKEKVAV